jgi:hypothetical protein
MPFRRRPVASRLAVVRYPIDCAVAASNASLRTLKAGQRPQTAYRLYAASGMCPGEVNIVGESIRQPTTIACSWPDADPDPGVDAPGSDLSHHS